MLTSTLPTGDYGERAKRTLLGQVAMGHGGCWVWTGKTNDKGYGRFSLTLTGRRSWSAHLAAYRLFVGPVPQGLQLDHTCHNADLTCPGRRECLHRRCLNPAHLEPVTSGVNTLRSPIHFMAINARKTHCDNGHEFNEANTLYRTRSGRACRRCHRDSTRRRRAQAA